MVQPVCYWKRQMVMNILYISKRLFCMCIEWFHLEQFLSLISATAIKTAIQCDLVGISNFPLQIWILLEKQVHVQVKPSHLENVAQPLLVLSSLFWV